MTGLSDASQTGENAVWSQVYAALRCLPPAAAALDGPRFHARIRELRPESLTRRQVRCGWLASMKRTTKKKRAPRERERPRTRSGRETRNRRSRTDLEQISASGAASWRPWCPSVVRRKSRRKSHCPRRGKGSAFSVVIPDVCPRTALSHFCLFGRRNFGRRPVGGSTRSLASRNERRESATRARRRGCRAFRRWI